MGLQEQFAKTKEKFDNDILNYMREHPEKSHREVALIFGCWREYVAKLASEHSITRPMGRPKKVK